MSWVLVRSLTRNTRLVERAVTDTARRFGRGKNLYPPHPIVRGVERNAQSDKGQQREVVVGTTAHEDTHGGPLQGVGVRFPLCLSHIQT